MTTPPTDAELAAMRAKCDAATVRPQLGSIRQPIVIPQNIVYLRQCLNEIERLRAEVARLQWEIDSQDIREQVAEFLAQQGHMLDDEWDCKSEVIPIIVTVVYSTPQGLSAKKYPGTASLSAIKAEIARQQAEKI